MTKLERVGGLLLAVGFCGVGLAFTSLIRDRSGTEIQFVLAGFALVAGLVIYLWGRHVAQLRGTPDDPDSVGGKQ